LQNQGPQPSKCAIITSNCAIIKWYLSLTIVVALAGFALYHYSGAFIFLFLVCTNWCYQIYSSIENYFRKSYPERD